MVFTKERMEIKHFVSWREDNSESMNIKKTSKHFQHFKGSSGVMDQVSLSTCQDTKTGPPPSKGLQVDKGPSHSCLRVLGTQADETQASVISK